MKIGVTACLAIVFGVLGCGNAQGQQISLKALVTPSTVVEKDGHPVMFAVHGYIEFQSLRELFPYAVSQSERWKSDSSFSAKDRDQLRRDLLREGIESRVISMVDERPLETLITHTRAELEQALSEVKEPVPPNLFSRYRTSGSTR